MKKSVLMVLGYSLTMLILVGAAKMIRGTEVSFEQTDDAAPNCGDPDPGPGPGE